MNCPWDQEVKLWEQFGWHSIEIWASKIQAQMERGASLPALRRQMVDAGARPIGLCVGAIGPDPRPGTLERELQEIEKLLDLCNEMGSPALTVVMFGDAGDDLAAVNSILVDKLHAIAARGEARGVRISLEFLGGLDLNGTLGSAIEFVNRVDHSHFGLLLDLCHYYTSASHLEELELMAPEKLFMVHLDDAQNLPMERLKNEQRCFPGEGRINLPGMMRALQRFGYRGPYTVELYDRDIWALDPLDVMTRLHQSLCHLEKQLIA